jgi:ABC-2 type transport system permease protein
VTERTEITREHSTGETETIPAAGMPPRIAPVRIPDRGPAHNLRAIKIVWKRELIRFGRDRMRIFTALLQPVLFLFVLGTGLSSIAAGGTDGVNLRTFMFPGVLAMAVLFTAVFSAGSIVWDREFGFLREMLVAPVSRGAIVFGKCLGGATVATFQGLLVLCLAGLVHVPYSPGLFAVLVAELLLLAFTLTAFGVMAAARIQQFQSFMALTQMFLMPLFFLSGALFPLSGLPTWLQVITKLNPLTYAVDPIRHAVFAHLHMSDAARVALNPGISWWGWHVPTLVELAVVVAMGLGMLGAAIFEFSRSD